MRRGNRPYSRRAFLRISGLSGLTAAAVPFLISDEAEAFLFNKHQYKVSKTRLAMGTFVAMTAVHDSRDQAEDAFDQVFAEISRLSSLLSRYADGSPITELNNTGIINGAPAEVIQVVRQSLGFYVSTGGAFDISVKPLLDLYQTRFEMGRQPDQMSIDAALQRIDCTKIVVDGDRISFFSDGMGVTLDGIAKGYIVDRASELLCRLGVTDHLINAGGDIRVSGTAVKGKKWKIAIQDPNKKGEYPAVISMSNGAIATSGNYEIFYDREKVFHHIINSRTGYSPQLSASVSITAPTVAEADALSTAIFVMEPDDGTAFINGCPDYESFVIDRKGNTVTSKNWG